VKRILPPLALAAGVLILLASGSPAATLYLKSGPIDTAAQVEAEVAPVHEQGSGYYLVAFSGPITESDKSSLSSAGAEIVEYIPNFALLVRIERSLAGQLRKLPGVDWVGPLKAEHKAEAQELLGSGSRAGQFIVTLFPGQDERFVLDKAHRLGIRSIARAKHAGRAVLRVLADGSQLAGLAKLNSVAWIEPYVQPKLANDQAEAICEVPEIRQNPGLFGAGQIVACADNGLDTGSLSTISADFAGRVLQTYGLRRPTEWSDLNGHGTHVVGSMLGSGALSGSNPSAHVYTGSFAGYAPEAQLVFQSIGDSGDYVFPPLHLAELFQPVYDDGARVHSDSWGSAVKGEYTTYSNEVDQFIWDHKDFTVAFAVGNDARDLDQNGVSDLDNILAPATAKNCISVGATENLRTTGGYQMGYGVAWPSDFPAAPIKYDLVSNNPDGIAAWSGRGPTDDGRVKPDICAPGANIISCRTHANPSVAGWSVYDSNYIYWGGTSMSTPQVAGAAALVREYYHREKGINASAALVKATLIDGASDISPGQYGTGSHQEVFPVPDFSQGWGRLDLKNAIYPDPPLANEFADESSALSTGETREYQYTVVDAGVPLKATLVWTDYPGAVLAAKELVNDLDLTVVSPTGALFPTGGICDHTNNVEQVRIATPQAGTYKVRVTGYNVPMGPQDYALVASGGLPNTYISGTVASSSGAGVQGALIMLVWANGLKRVTTNLSGKYLTRVAPGTYSVQIGKSGWTFTPRARVVTVSSAPVENVDFRGNGAPGSLSGSVTSAVGGVVSSIVESPHPYLNNCDQTYVITAYQGASHVRVHFAEIDLMSDGDTIYILDGADNIKNTYTGRGEDIWSSWADGNLIKIRIVTNALGNIGYGFYADGYETDLIDQGALAGATLTLSPGGYQAATGQDGVYTFASTPPGTYTAAPSKPHWKFQPASKTVELPAGGAASDVDFLAFPPGSITGQVLTVNSQTHAVNIQSPHNYPDNYDETWTITADVSVTRMRLHFPRIDTEPAWDLIYILDGDDNIVEIYTAHEEDLWTPWVNGHVAKINFTSDSGVNDWGFACDAYEAQVTGAGLAGAHVTLDPDGRSASTQVSGAFSLADVDVGGHTVSCSLDLWTFDPASKLVSISPGMQENLLLYASVQEMTLPCQAKSIPDGVQVTIKGAVVSARFNGFFYTQDPARTSGLRVTWPGAVTEGSLIDITGTLSTTSGERRITATLVTPH